MERNNRLDQNGERLLQDLPYIINWRSDRCIRCGRCTAVCPVKAITPGVFIRRLVESSGDIPLPSTLRTVYNGIRQVNDISRYCTGCGQCSLVCPNLAIMPQYNPHNKLLFHINKNGEPYRRGGRRNDPSISTLDKLKFIRISMLTDPALDADRHEFYIRTLLGRNIPAEKLSLKTKDDMLTIQEGSFIPPVREIYPIRIGGMSIGALSPNMWEGLAMGVAYLNENYNMPVVMSTGEGGMPPRLLRSRFLKYFILQIASGYFGWDEIIHAIPDMVEDPAAIEIKYGQGAKPGDGGLLMAQKVLKLIASIRGVPQFVDLASPPTHQTKYSIEEA
ncbi:4Fe-4S binding protein, partial [Candidatus Desantisbacteria bacterium]|nr:4Fe-4S binding protein [Candidatus Desantisbacteria bacterium]